MITSKSLPEITVNQEPYCFQALPKRCKTTKSRKGARRLRFADTDSLLLEEAIQRNQLLHQAQRLFTEMQLSSINVQEGIFCAYITNDEHQHLLRHSTTWASSSTWGGTLATLPQTPCLKTKMVPAGTWMPTYSRNVG